MIKWEWHFGVLPCYGQTVRCFKFWHWLFFFFFFLSFCFHGCQYILRVLFVPSLTITGYMSHVENTRKYDSKGCRILCNIGNWSVIYWDCFIIVILKIEHICLFIIVSVYEKCTYKTANEAQSHHTEFVFFIPAHFEQFL